MANGSPVKVADKNGQPGEKSLSPGGRALGTYRYWRDTGYAIGGLLLGSLAQWRGKVAIALWATTGLLLLSGLWVGCFRRRPIRGLTRPAGRVAGGEIGGRGGGLPAYFRRGAIVASLLLGLLGSPGPVSAAPPSSTPASGLPGAASSPPSVPANAEETPLSLNGPDALAAYKHSWNPLTAGPDLVSYADTLPEGVFNARFFFYTRFTQAQYTDSGGIASLPPNFYETQMLALEAMYFGLGSNTELAVLPSLIGTFSSIGGTPLDGWGLNDFTIGVKHRWIIQNPNSARPSFATFLFVTLPTTSWLGTPVPRGGLPPVSVLPATHFGSPSLTGTFLVRKNLRPLRFYGGLYYTYSFPGIESVTAADPKFFAQFGDLVQYRMAVEDVIDENRGLGFLLEMVGLSELPFSLDGIAVNTRPATFNLIGVQPSVEINLTDRLAFSAGVLLPAWGTSEYLSTTPNFSLWYYFGKGTLQR